MHFTNSNFTNSRVHILGEDFNVLITHFEKKYFSVQTSRNNFGVQIIRFWCTNLREATPTLGSSRAPARLHPWGLVTHRLGAERGLVQGAEAGGPETIRTGAGHGCRHRAVHGLLRAGARLEYAAHADGRRGSHSSGAHQTRPTCSGRKNRNETDGRVQYAANLSRETIRAAPRPSTRGQTGMHRLAAS